MRCPKCGTIDFDYLTQCSYCKTDLSKTKEKLGNIIQNSSNPVNWLESFQLDNASSNVFKELDVSDLVRPDYGVDEVASLELEPIELNIEEIAHNEELKKKLDELDVLLEK